MLYIYYLQNVSDVKILDVKYFGCLIFGQFLSHFKQISGHNFSTWLKQRKYTATKQQ